METEKIVARLRELVTAITTGKTDGEFTMRIPAEPERDADLVLSAAADKLAELEAEAERLQSEWELMYAGRTCPRCGYHVTMNVDFVTLAEKEESE